MTGPAGGTWRQGWTQRAQCGCCDRWVIDERAWRYWLGLVCHATICNGCAESAAGGAR